MIKKLKQRFIRIAVVALTVAMVLVVGVVNLANWISVRSELAGMIELLPQFGPPGDFLSGGEEGGGENGEKPAEAPVDIALRLGKGRHFANMVAESSWCSVLFDEDGSVRGVMMDRMENTDEETVRALALQAKQSGKETGFLQDYMFMFRDNRGETEMVLLNCETRLAGVRNLVLLSCIACAGGILLAWLMMTLLSRRAVEPTIRNMEQQKQFITDASHELKTPLTVIATNMELLAMETEDNQWVRSTQKQTGVMRRLVDELVYLSRMEEEHPTLEMETLDPGAVLKETAEPFIAMAEFSGREMRAESEEGLRMTGDRASIQRLISTLCDNAVKYASEGPILAEAKAEGRNILIRVSNPVAEPLSKEQCGQLFSRFYRADASRSKEKKGFGIGLAIAAAITEKHGGKISAAMEGNRIVFSCLLPREGKKQ